MGFNTSDNNQAGLTFNELRSDEAAFEAFFKQHYTPLCAYCQFKFGFDIDLSTEIVHNAFVKLWEARQQPRIEGSPTAYLHTIIVNSSLDVLRHEKVKQQYVQFVHQTATEEDLLNTIDSIDFRQLRNDIDKAVAELPEQMQRIFVLSRFEGLKYTEIAGRLNISVKTVETQMSRALAKLREKLSGYLSLILVIVSLFGKK